MDIETILHEVNLIIYQKKVNGAEMVEDTIKRYMDTKCVELLEEEMKKHNKDYGCDFQQFQSEIYQELSRTMIMDLVR